MRVFKRAKYFGVQIDNALDWKKHTQRSNLVCLGYGNVPLFGGSFFLKSAECCVSLFEICAEFWVPFEEKCKIMGSIFEKCCKMFVVY